jgi:outer membrane receptor protein involved in Fe transport
MDNDRDINIAAFKADYVKPISEKSTFEAGVKSSFVRTDNDLYATTPVDGVWTKDENRSNHFLYSENIYAGYVSYATKINKISLSGGLRGEYTYYDGYSETLNQRNKREYMSFFPNVSIEYAASDKHQFGITYSRRIDRPNYRDLNPFVFMLDKYTYQKGNPFLNPQFTHSVELGYTFMGSMNVSLSYGNTNSGITEVLEQDNAAQATYQTNANLNLMENYALSVSAPFPLRKWWFLYANVNAFYNKVSSPFSQGEINTGKLTAILNLNNTFSLPHDIKLEASAYYQSPLIYGIFDLKSQYQFDLGVSKKFGDWNVRLSLADVFDTRENRVKIKQGDLDVNIVNKWETRVARINLSYTFGNSKLKMSKARKTAASDIEQRVK